MVLEYYTILRDMEIAINGKYQNQRSNIINNSPQEVGFPASLFFDLCFLINISSSNRSIATNIANGAKGARLAKLLLK